MGCGKSKPDVATGNILSQSKGSSDADHAKKSKDIETIPEKTTNNTNTNTNTQRETKIVKEEDPNSSIQPKQGNEIAEKKEIDNIKVVAVKEDVKINADSKEGDGNEDKDKKKQGELISGTDSPVSRFFSTRRDEETIEAVISEGMSGTSEYFSPRAKVVLDESEKIANILEENGPVEETKMETKNEKPTKVEEENLIEEVKVVPTVEPKDSATMEQEETLSAAKEIHVTADSSTKDPKTDLGVN